MSMRAIARHDPPTRKSRGVVSATARRSAFTPRRIEALVEITNPTVHAQIIDQIMAANMADQVQSWVQQADGSYLRHSGEASFSCHRFFMETPSLSGRGRAGAKDVTPLTYAPSLAPEPRA